MRIDETAALKSCSWGLGQILGENHVAAGYGTVREMVADFTLDEGNHLEAMIRFVKAHRLDDEIRTHDWAGFARGYNGPQFKKNGYDTKLAAAFAKWSRIKDTPDGIPSDGTEIPPPDVPVPVPVPLPVPLPAPVPKPVPAAPAAPAAAGRFFSAALEAIRRAFL